jgi:hypothetical protein
LFLPKTMYPQIAPLIRLWILDCFFLILFKRQTIDL